MSTKNICVIGAGYWGKNHIRTLYELGALGGIVETNREVLSELSSIYPDVKTYSQLDDALTNDEFAGFTIATPAQYHYKLAKLVIEKGKSVLVEKPFTLDSKEAKHLKELSESMKVNLMVGHVLLFHPAIQKIKQLITGGKIGTLQYIYSNRLNLGKVRTKENVFWSFAPHDISIFQYLTDSYPQCVTSTGGAFLRDTIHDITMTVLEYPENIKGHIFVSWLHPFKEHRLVVIGSDGMLRFEDSAEGKPLVFYDKSFEWSVGVPVKRDGATEAIHYNNKMPLKEELKYFTDHLGNEKPQIANGKNAVEVMEILEKATESLNDGVIYELIQNESNLIVETQGKAESK